MGNLGEKYLENSLLITKRKRVHTAQKRDLKTAKGIKVTKWFPLRFQCRDKPVLLASCGVWPPKESRIHSLPQVQCHSGFFRAMKRTGHFVFYKGVYAKELYWVVVIRANALVACLESKTGFPMLKLHSSLMVNLVYALWPSNSLKRLS